MKKILSILAVAAAVASCNLDIIPRTQYNEGNVEVKTDEETGSENQYSTREDMEGLRNSIYNNWIKDIQEKGYLDYLVSTECRADNAYNGSPSTAQIVEIESNTVTSGNTNVSRDWDWYLGQVANANQIICNIDAIRDASGSTLTDSEYRQWKSEALTWRAFNLARLAQIWGGAPMTLTVPPAINAANVEQVYDLYFPKMSDAATVYGQAIQDLEYAAENGPEVNPSNKFLLSKAFAAGLLARIYAEPGILQDWGKVEQYCKDVEGMGFQLEPNYADLWGYDTDDAKRNSKESIFEVTWSRDQGNWLWMMFHRNAYNPDDSYTWAKWITPSRDLIMAYEAAGDEVRKNASIIFDACSWSLYYPEANYAFMHKLPTNASSVIVMRLAEIYLLHAEALAKNGDLKGATEYVNKTRGRAGLAGIPQPADEGAMIDAILAERRLELSFEGFRFYDLVRHGKAAAVAASVASTDSYWRPRRALTPQTILFPIPVSALEQNPNLKQNEGY